MVDFCKKAQQLDDKRQTKCGKCEPDPGDEYKNIPEVSIPHSPLKRLSQPLPPHRRV